MDEDQIKEFENFILQIPGIYCNPILAKFNTYKRVIKPEPKKTEFFSDSGQKLGETQEESNLEKQEPES